MWERDPIWYRSPVVAVKSNRHSGICLMAFHGLRTQPVIGVSEVEFEAGESYEEASINWLAKNGIGPVEYSGRDNIRVEVVNW